MEQRRPLAASQDVTSFTSARRTAHATIGPSGDASLLSGLRAPATDPRCRRAGVYTLATRTGWSIYYVDVATIGCPHRSVTVALVAGCERVLDR